MPSDEEDYVVSPEEEDMAEDDGSLSSSSPDDDPDRPRTIKDISDDGGVLKQIIRSGHGWQKPQIGDKVEVHYVGRLKETGEIFDSSRERNEKFSFIRGSNQVIKGWEVAIATMKRNELARFVINPSYAYGETGAPPKIPANATLEFEIELFDWKMEDLTPKKDGGVLKRVVVDGSKYTTPNEGSTVELELEGKYEGKTFEKRTAVFTLGEGIEQDIPEGIEIAVGKMKMGERSEVYIRPKYLWGIGVGKPDFKIPDDFSQVMYELHLKNFEKLKESYEMTEEELLEQSELSKTKGNDYFKQGKFSLALKMYKRIVNNLGMNDKFQGELLERRNPLLLAGHLNCAICYVKLNETFDAIRSCNLALEMDPTNEKALFRRGTAYCTQKDYRLARKDFAQVLQLDPNNKAAKHQYAITTNAVKAQFEREKATYRNLFSRISKGDETQKKNGVEEDAEIVEPAPEAAES